MTLIDAILRKEEGCRLEAYTDTRGNLTIGWGHKVTDDESYIEITQEQADSLLEDDIMKAHVEVLKALPWTFNLDEAREAVLVSMAFQLGLADLLDFRETLAHVKAKQWQDAHDAMLDSEWAQQTPARAQRMAYMMLTADTSYYDA